MNVNNVNSVKTNEFIKTKTFDIGVLVVVAELNPSDTLCTYLHTVLHMCIHACTHMLQMGCQAHTFHCMTCFQVFYKHNKLLIDIKAFCAGCLPHSSFGVENFAGTIWGVALLFSSGIFFLKGIHRVMLCHTGKVLLCFFEKLRYSALTFDK